MSCDCLNQIDAKLSEKNLKLTGYTFVWSTDGPMDVVPTVATNWLDREKAPKGKKNNPTVMMASHCPFCGEPVNEKQHVEGKREDRVAERMRLELATALGWGDTQEDLKLPEWKALLEQVRGLQAKVNCFSYLSDPTKPIRYTIGADKTCKITHPVCGTARDLQQGVEWCIEEARKEEQRQAQRAK